MKLLSSNKKNAVETDPAFPLVPNRWIIITVNPVRRKISDYGKITTLFLSIIIFPLQLPSIFTSQLRGLQQVFFAFFLCFWASVQDVEMFVSVQTINSALIP